ncbi:MAG TPA: Gfo/Idh/MocA family oxidoreductase, partial [Anaerolineae bacterium]|nr:Gfo/Idh/MocA family oxidoreductase [Anaerolineae bacterium]
MSDRNLSVGVIGTGFIGPAHIEALRRLGIYVVALAENSQERALEKAQNLKIGRGYGSAEEMIAQP